MRRLMVSACVRAAEAKGFTMTRRPGRGLSTVYDAKSNGKTKVLCIRTSRSRWFAFPSLNNGKKWKTLDDCDLVMVAAFDDEENPKAINIYMFPADEVQKRFDAAYKARIKAGLTVKEGFGMWILLDEGDEEYAAQAGHSLSVDYPTIQTVKFNEMMELGEDEYGGTLEDTEEDVTDEHELVEHSKSPIFATVAEILAFAREHIAQLTGMPAGSISLDLRMGI